MRYLVALILILSSTFVGCQHLTPEQLGDILDRVETAAFLYLEYEERGDLTRAARQREEMEHQLTLLERINEMRRERGQREVEVPEIAQKVLDGDE